VLFAVQVKPPLLVITDIPPLPTAMQLLVSRQVIALSQLLTPALPTAQDKPPLELVVTAPP
jgi:hypothetical protein